MPTQEERIRFWALSYSRSSLLEAKDAIAEFKKGGHSDIVRRALISTVVIAYYRPFTEARIPEGKKIVPLSVTYVPKALRTIHDDLGKLRNRVFGHKDASEIGADGVLHKVLLHADAGGVDIHTLIPIDASEQLLTQGSMACDAIISRVSTELLDFIQKHLKQKLAIGWHEVLLKDEGGVWIKQKQ